MKKYFLILIIFFLAQYGYGQEIIKVLDIQGGPVISTVAIDRKSLDTWNVVTSSGAVLTTNNKGESWNENEIKSTDNNHSWLFSNKKGHLFRFVLIGENTIESSESDDAGETWEPIGTLSMKNMVGLPTLFFHPNDEDVLISYLRLTDCLYEVIFVASGNLKKWSDPVVLNGSGVACDSAHVTPASIGKGPQDYFYAIWSQNNGLLMDRSFDEGKKWLRSDISVQRKSGQLADIPPRISTDRSKGMLQGSIYVAWQMEVDGKHRSLVARSANSGDFWSPAITLIESENNVVMPAMAIDQSNGIVFTAVFEQVSENEYDVHLLSSKDGAQTFTSKKVNSASVVIPDESFLKNNLSVDVFKNRVVLIWSDFTGGTQNITMFSAMLDELNKKD